MHHPKSFRSRYARSMIIPAALLGVILSGCAEVQPTSTKPLSVASTQATSFTTFFNAWSQNFTDGPIRTQVFALDPRQDRQFINWYVDEQAQAFARAYPGRLYIDGDEPDQYCTSAYDYAGMYHDFVVAIRAADPTARVSPAGFAEPNGHCCPNPTVACSEVHGIAYANQFYSVYIQRYGVAPPVNEWRFHDFGVTFAPGDMNGWWGRVDAEAAWSVAHGANMVLGGWGLHGWPGWESTAAFQEHLKIAMGRLMNDKRINGASYWSYEPWVESPRPLANADGSLTTEGQTYANPLTDVPVSVTLAASANGTAKLQWGNSTNAWGAEAEFWAAAPGSQTFVYRSTELVSGAGATQSPSVKFNAGESVRARVRYYNVFAQAPWSSFSNTVVLAQAASGSEGGVPGKRPLFCKLQLC
jgi:hypothetical protein